MRSPKSSLILSAVTFIFLCGVAYSGSSGKQHWRNRAILEPIVLIHSFDQQTKGWRPFATGTLIKTDTTASSVYLITNRHVLVGKDSIKLEMNVYQSRDSTEIVGIAYQLVNLKKPGVFIPSTQDSDFAAVRLQVTPRASDLGSFGPQQFVSFDDLNYGELLEFYGYPNYANRGLYGPDYHFPIVRMGAASYFTQQDIYLDTSKFMIPGTFLLDGVSVGGNSGGPVFIKRPFVGKTANEKITVYWDRRLAGIISSHYTDPQYKVIPLSKIPLISKALEAAKSASDSLLVSQFTRDVVVDFEENADLAVVYSIDLVLEYIRVREATGK